MWTCCTLWQRREAIAATRSRWPGAEAGQRFEREELLLDLDELDFEERDFDFDELLFDFVFAPDDFDDDFDFEPPDFDLDDDFVSPACARCLLTVRAAISSARSSDRPASSSDSLTCSYCRSRFALHACWGIGLEPPCGFPDRQCAYPLRASLRAGSRASGVFLCGDASAAATRAAGSERCALRRTVARGR